MLTTTDHPVQARLARLPAGVHLDVRGPSQTGHVQLRLLGVSDDYRGRGLARTVLADLCERADEHGWTVTLDATTDLGADLRRLVAWYSRHGFVIDRTEQAVIPHRVPMIRRPAFAHAA